jgi:hypothetical protein
MRNEHFSAFAALAEGSGVVLYHSGPLDEPLVTAIAAMLRQRLQEDGASGATGRKVFSTFMEMAQNILHYSNAQAAGERMPAGALGVVRSGEGYEVLCGNFLPAGQVERVRGKLESIRAMEPDQVRQAYRRQLASEEEDPDSKGAGLGLLTMAASARAPIEYRFDPAPGMDGERSYLFLKALI